MSWGAWIYPSTVTDATRDLGQALKGVDQTVQSCVSLPDDVRASWGAFYITVSEFISSWDPTFPLGYFGLGSRMDQVDAYGKTLGEWQARLETAKCSLTSPKFNPKPLDPASNWTQIARWTALGALGVSTAYVVGKVVEFIPKPRERRQLSR